MPGTLALNTGKFAEITAVSCTSPGNCTAGGHYAQDHAGSVTAQAFVVSEVRGRWNRAEEVPGSGALNIGGYAEITSVSCTPGGHCVAGGTYIPADLRMAAFVVSRG